MMNVKRLVFSVTVGLALSAFQLNAATVTYLRFEDSNNLGTSTGAGTLDLTAQDNLPSGSLGTVATGGTGPAASFPDPVPQNGLANGEAVDLQDRNGILTYTYGPSDDQSFNTNNFTFEAFFNAATPSSTSNNNYLGSLWGNTDSWGVGIGAGASTAGSVIPEGDLFFLHYDGSSNQIINTGINFSRDNDYYVGITVNSTGANSVLNVYYQDLDAGGALQSGTFNLSGTVANANDSIFTVGSLAGGYSNGWSGVMDEVRHSDTVLSQNELLAIPEPSTLVLSLGGLLAAAMVLRRRRS